MSEKLKKAARELAELCGAEGAMVIIQMRIGDLNVTDAAIQFEECNRQMFLSLGTHLATGLRNQEAPPDVIESWVTDMANCFYLGGLGVARPNEVVS